MAAYPHFRLNSRHSSLGQSKSFNTLAGCTDFVHYETKNRGPNLALSFLFAWRCLMVRRLKADFDQRQLGLFGEGLALGVKPSVVKVLPPAVLDVAKPAAKVSTPPIQAFPKSRNLASLPPEIVRPPEAASLLSVSLSLLKKWRIGGGGPRFVRLGGRAIGYRRVDLSRSVSYN
jgi:hypothetical protein